MRKMIAFLALAFAALTAAPALNAQAGSPIGYTSTGLPVFFAATPAFGVTQALTTQFSTASTSFVSTGLVMPSIPAGQTIHGTCDLIWQQATAAATVSFGTAMSNAPTGLYILSKINTAAAGSNTVAYTTTTATTGTIVGAAATPGAAATNYYAAFDFVLVTGASPVVLTWEGLTSNALDSLVVQPGSHCGWTF
jgi:hypothetical protein